MVTPKTKIITAEVDTNVAEWLDSRRKKGEIKTMHINEALKQYIKNKIKVVKPS